MRAPAQRDTGSAPPPIQHLYELMQQLAGGA
jgi:hypothetical protein